MPRTNPALIKTALSLLVLLTAMMWPSVASADPIVITGGSIHYTASGPGSFNVSGAGFSAAGITTTLNSGVSLFAVGSLSPGASRSTGGSIDVQDAELFVSGPVTIGGTVFSPASTLLIFGFSSESFQAPTGLFPGFIVTAPFTLTSGLIEGYPGLIGQGIALFSSPLTGSGTTTLSFLLTPSGQYVLQSQTFVFGQTVSGVSVQSIPEPASLLLLGTSLAALLGIRRKR